MAAEKDDVGTTVDVPIVRRLECKSRVDSEIRWDMPDGIWPVRELPDIPRYLRSVSALIEAGIDPVS